ncbi:hypothetical protein H7F15_04930 [Pontibacter sp. Tf4]|uniref:hypothetical protein n=1 Tax=Pontibacter sp. Tf4 TaxID=2761620 RepID=UPI00162545D0|nr:hypothetical protein [Pontibacter sp. Tf4]MBB6610374.1 hypothetical protein [Pontibacter sp. Tf4]
MKRIFCLLLLILPVLAQAQQKDKTEQAEKFKLKRWYLPFQVNAFDRQQEYHGRWKLYTVDGKGLVRNGRFRHGHEVGTWRYYYPNGKLFMKEKYMRNSPVIKVWRYYENGKLAKAGPAKYYNTATIAHYYWEGEWQVYDEQGNYSHTETYIKGNLLNYKH